MTPPNVLRFALPTLRFPPATRAALLALPYALPFSTVHFGADDDGDEWATVECAADDGPGGVIIAIAQRGGVLLLDAGHVNGTLGVFRDPEALGEAVRAFLEHLQPLSVHPSPASLSLAPIAPCSPPRLPSPCNAIATGCEDASGDEAHHGAGDYRRVLASG